MKSRKYQSAYRNNSSKLHKKVGEILKTSDLFRHYKVYQEYPVTDINPSFNNSRCKFDWVILDIKVVIEVHGAQHYVVSSFGADPEEAVNRFQRQKIRDAQKQLAAEEAGWGYVEVSYKEIKNLTPDNLWEKIKLALSLVSESIVKIDTRKEKARKWRKEQYAKYKSYLKQQREMSQHGLSNQGHSENNSQTQDEKTPKETEC